MKIRAMTAGLLMGSAAAFLLLGGSANAQLLKGRALPKEREAKNTALQANKTIQSALAHSVRVNTTSMPGGFADGSHSAIIVVLRKQSAAARALIGLMRPSAARGGDGGTTRGGTLLGGGTGASPTGASAGESQAASRPGMLLKPGSTPALNAPGSSVAPMGAERTMSSSGAGIGTAPQPPAHPLTPTNGPSKHQSPGAQHPAARLGARAPTPTQLCRAGIGTVDGAANGVWFSPVAGQDGQFVIQGCGFGTAPGQVYLSGVQYDPARTHRAVQRLGNTGCPGCVYFETEPGGWSDRQIVVRIDPNASGFYDTNNVRLVVKTASGQVYQAPGMNFLAARADQLLPWIVPPPAGYSGFVADTSFLSTPTAVIHLTKVIDSSSQPMVPTVASPSAGTIWSNETVDAMRAELGPSTSGQVTFPGGTDSYQLHLAPGFQLDPHSGVGMRHTQIDVAQCQTSFHGKYTSQGNWGLNYTSKTSFQISWQEQACWPKAGSGGGDPRDYGSVSVYALQITVLGPRGVSPWASGKVNPVTIKMVSSGPLLKKQ